MSEVTREDIKELHGRIDDMVTIQTKTSIAVARIETKLNMQPAPPERPCKELVDHLEDHKETKKLWQTPLVKTIIDVAKMGLVAFFTWMFLRSKGGK